MLWRTHRHPRMGESVRNIPEVGKRMDLGQAGVGELRVRRTRGPPGLLESALVSPVPIEERLAQTLGAGLMEPLQAALALQHFQVPPEGDTGLVTSRHSLLNCPTLLTTYSHPLQHSPHFISWDSPPTTLCHSFVNPAPHYSLPRTTTVTVALLPVAQMSSIPVQPLQSIWQRQLHTQHGSGIGALLQCTPPLQR